MPYRSYRLEMQVVEYVQVHGGGQLLQQFQPRLVPMMSVNAMHTLLTRPTSTHLLELVDPMSSHC